MNYPGLAIVATVLATFSAWITHIVVTLHYLTDGADSVAYAILLLIGVFAPPVGVIHGVGVWFGAW